MRDSVRTIRRDTLRIIQEKSSLEIDPKLMDNSTKTIILGMDLPLTGPKSPEYVAQITTKLSDSFKIPTHSDSGSIDFVYQPKLQGNNELTIKGNIPYSISMDSLNAHYKLLTLPLSLSLSQKIDISTSLYRDNKNRLMTRVSTTYPNIVFNEINSTYFPKVLREERKRFGIGLSVGWNPINKQINAVIGLNITPKWLQF